MQPLFRTANTPSLHDQAVAFWENSKAHHIRPAIITDEQRAAIVALIEEDKTAITHADCMAIHDRWDDLFQKITAANGHDFYIDGILTAYCPFTGEAMLAQVPE